MFKTIFVENQVKDHPQTQRVLGALSSQDVRWIDRVDDVFGRVRKPYLQKRDSLNLFLGRKHGELIKEAPDAYGTIGAKHFYFIHAYNCIYECEYCFLQGYFDSPDIVMFVNHDEICQAIIDTTRQHADQEVWFHGGEFSDSLALSGLSHEWEIYWETFAKLPNAFLELRSKSAHTRAIESLPVLDNVVPSFSLSPEASRARFDRRTPPTKVRLRAAKKLQKMGYRIGLHLDPIIADDQVIPHYTELLEQISQELSVDKILYVSVGVVRFTKDVYHQVQRHYPDSEIFRSELIKAKDGKVRYMKPYRMALLHRIRNLCLEVGIPSARIYLCMES